MKGGAEERCDVRLMMRTGDLNARTLSTARTIGTISCEPAPRLKRRWKENTVVVGLIASSL